MRDDLNEWDLQRQAMYEAWDIEQKEKEASKKAQRESLQDSLLKTNKEEYYAIRRHLGGNSWAFDVYDRTDTLIYAFAGQGLQDTYLRMRNGISWKNERVKDDHKLLEIQPVTIWYSMQNGGDGSAYPYFFLTEDEASFDQMTMDYGWGEDCSGPVETFVGSKTYLDAVQNSKELEERCKF